MPELVLELEYHAALAAACDCGAGPYGQRVIVIVTGGDFSGERMKGTIPAGGGDWLVIGPDGYGRLDVKATFRTHDGANIYLTYGGLIEITPAIGGLLSGEAKTPTNYGDQYFFTQPRLETGDERYAWVNQAVWIGQGRVLPASSRDAEGSVFAVEYRLFRVVN